jgi:hypothetical protein
MLVRARFVGDRYGRTMIFVSCPCADTRRATERYGGTPACSNDDKVLTNENAWFLSTCRGRTECVAEVWNQVKGTVLGPVVQAGQIGSVELPAPAPTALDGLPSASARFLGREEELAWLAESSGVVVVCGLAGAGKTELEGLRVFRTAV